MAASIPKPGERFRAGKLAGRDHWGELECVRIDGGWVTFRDGSGRLYAVPTDRLLGDA